MRPDKNTIIGWSLIAVVFIGFMIYNNYSQKKQVEEKKLQQKTEAVAQQKSDSIKVIETAKAEAKLAEQKTDSANVLFKAQQGSDGETVIKNSLLKLTISNKGGKIKKAEILDQTYRNQEGKNVILFNGEDSQFSLLLDGKTDNIKTSDYCFTPTNPTDSSVVMSLPIAEGSLDITYTLKSGCYLVDIDVKANNIAGIFPSKTDNLTIKWDEKLRRQEKSFTFENRYSTITYRTVDGSTDELSSSGSDEDADKEDFEQSVKWIAYKTQFFSQVLIADKELAIESMSSKQNDKDSAAAKTYLKNLKSSFTVPFDPTGKNVTGFTMYLGPNKFSTLKENEEIIGSETDLDLQSIVYLGWPVVRWINRFVFLYMFDFMTSWGINMGLVLLLITIIVKIAVFPLVRKSYLSSANMRVLRPKVDEINAKYPKPEDAMKKQQETMQLYSQYGVSPMGGCLPMVIQMPIWIALFNFIPNAIELRGQSFLWANDLSTYDDIIHWSTPIWGIGDHISLFCVLWSVSMVANTWISMRQQSYSMSPEQEQSMKFMRWFSYAMPFIFFFSFNEYASGLNFYYFISGLISILTMWALRKTTDDAKLLAKLEARFKDRKSNPRKTSSLMERMQAMAAQQQEILKQQEAERQNRKN